MKDSVKGIGIGLIVVGALGYLGVLAGIFVMVTGANDEAFRELEREFGPQAGNAIKLFSQWVGILLGVVGSAVLIFGGLQMMRMKSWGLCVTACALAMLPCWGCCCIGFPLGGFGLYVLFQDEIKASFT